MSAGFRSLHPLPCFLYYASVMLFSLLLMHPVFLGVSILLLGILAWVYDSGKASIRTMLFFLLIGFAASLINPLFSHRGEHILFYMWDQPITAEAVWFGITLTCSMLSVLFAFLSYRHVVTNDKFLYLFSSLWPKGTLIIVMSLRFVPLLMQRLKAVSAVQETKGVSLLQGPLHLRAVNGMKMLQILLTWSLEESFQTADSMKSRGFGLGLRSCYAYYRLRSRDWLAVAFVVVVSGLCLAGRLEGYGVFTIYPELEAWKLYGAEWAELGLFAVLVGWPLAMEGKEWLVWRFLK